MKTNAIITDQTFKNRFFIFSQSFDVDWQPKMRQLTNNKDAMCFWHVRTPQTFLYFVFALRLYDEHAFKSMTIQGSSRQYENFLPVI